MIAPAVSDQATAGLTGNALESWSPKLHHAVTCVPLLAPQKCQSRNTTVVSARDSNCASSCWSVIVPDRGRIAASAITPAATKAIKAIVNAQTLGTRLAGDFFTLSAAMAIGTVAVCCGVVTEAERLLQLAKARPPEQCCSASALQGLRFAAKCRPVSW